MFAYRTQHRTEQVRAEYSLGHVKVEVGKDWIQEFLTCQLSTTLRKIDAKNMAAKSQRTKKLPWQIKKFIELFLEFRAIFFLNLCPIFVGIALCQFLKLKNAFATLIFAINWANCVQLNEYQTDPYDLQYFQSNITVCLIIHLFCKSCEPEIVLQFCKSKQKQFHVCKPYKMHE